MTAAPPAARRRDRDDHRLDQLGDAGAGGGGHQGLQRKRSLQAPLRVHHEDIVELADLLRLSPDLLDGLAGVEVCVHGDQLGGHQPTGGLLVVAEKVANVSGVQAGQRRQNAQLVLRIELADDVGGVVVGKLGDEGGDLLRLEQGERLLGVLVPLHLGERLGGEGGLGHERHQHRASLVLLELLEKVREIAGVEREKEGVQLGVLTRGDELANPRQQVRQSGFEHASGDGWGELRRDQRLAARIRSR